MKKLIRDHIPGIPDYTWYEETDKKILYGYLKDKLNEEIKELQDSDFTDIKEYADVLEVLMALSRFKKIKWSDIEIARRIKFVERGGFSNKIWDSEKV